jgi:hypothetical protein
MSTTAEEPAQREPTGWEIAIAVNAVVKGLLGSMGQSGHVCQRTIPVACWYDTSSGYASLCDQIARSVEGHVQSGDIVVVADKIVGLAQGRIGPAEILTSPDPKTVDAPTRAALAARWQRVCGFPITPLHLLLADEFADPRHGPAAALGCLDHNAAAAEIAGRVRTTTSVVVDVVISDTDTGLDVRSPLINTVTFGATPLGATAGLTLYEAMRCACAAEFERGHDKGFAVVICRPARRCADRPRTGEHRGYGGALDAHHEDGLTYA